MLLSKDQIKGICMTDFLLPWLLLASIQFAATASPGPAFVVGIRNAIVYGRVTGIATGIGLGLGVAVHVTLVLTGISLIVEQSPFVYNVIKYAGAAYLVCVGVKCLMSACKTFKQKNRKPGELKISDLNKKENKSLLLAVFQGFMTNLLNPKAVIFFTSVFSQFISLHTIMPIKILFGSTSVFIEASWYVLISMLLTNQSIQRKFLSVTHWIDSVFGGLIIFLGFRLAIHNL